MIKFSSISIIQDMIKKDEQNNLTKSFDRFECGLLPWTKIVLDQTYPLTEYNETVAPGEQSTSHPDILQSVPAIKRLVLCSGHRVARNY